MKKIEILYLKKNFLIYIRKWILLLIFPKKCAICGKIIGIRDKFIHKECLEKIKFIDYPFCHKCGKKLYVEGGLCDNCNRVEHIFTSGRSLFSRNELVRNMMFSFKYANNLYFGEFYGMLLGWRFYKFIISSKINIIIPVPLNNKKEDERGDNQSHIIGKSLYNYLVEKGEKVDYIKDLVIREKYTLPLKNYSLKDRYAKLKDAFILNEKYKWDIENKNILIIDDIYTSGSTIDTISKVLIDGGVKETYFLTVSSGS